MYFYRQNNESLNFLPLKVITLRIITKYISFVISQHIMPYPERLSCSFVKGDANFYVVVAL